MARFSVRPLEAHRAAWVAGICCAAGIALIGYPYYPLVKYAAFKAGTTSVAAQVPGLASRLPEVRADEVGQGNWVVIPSVNVKARIWEGESLAILDEKEGVWHQNGSLEGNYVVAGHRFQYRPPNTDTFYNLNKVAKGDKVILYEDGVEYSYSVTSVSEVESTQVEILDPTPEPQITLYTCKDLSFAKRIAVVATRDR